MTRPLVVACLLAVGVAAALPGCSSDGLQRGMYEGLRRQQEIGTVPGEDRKSLPGYDEYARQRKQGEPE